MNNSVSNLGTSANYPTPNVAQMANTVKQMSDQRAKADALFQLTHYLPSLNDKFARLHTSLIDTDRSVRDAAQKMAHQLSASLNDITNFQNDLLEEGLDEEDKSYFVKEIVKSVTQVLNVVQAEDSALTQQLVDISEKLNRQQTEELIAEQISLIETCKVDIEQSDTQLKSLREQRKVMNDGIDALKSKGFADKGNEIIGDVEKLVALGMTPPQLAIVQLAIEQAKKLLVETEQAISFFAMVKALGNLVDVIEATTKKHTDKQNDMTTATRRIEFINTLYAMDTLRTDYVSEASKVTQVTGFFLAQFPAGTKLPVEAFIEASPPFADCLSAIVRGPR